MNRTMSILVLIAAALFSYLAGVELGGSGFEIALYNTQGELAFNHLERYESIRSDLFMNCNEVTIQKLDDSIKEQKMLLAELINRFKSESVRQYIFSRISKLLDELDSYEVDWNELMVEVNC